MNEEDPQATIRKLKSHINKIKRGNTWVSRLSDNERRLFTYLYDAGGPVNRIELTGALGLARDRCNGAAHTMMSRINEKLGPVMQTKPPKGMELTPLGRELWRNPLKLVPPT